MGGIVAAETLLSIVGEQPIHSPQQSMSSLSDHSTLMFPYIQGILAFDTPYIGVAPGVVAHGAEKHWSTASQAYSAYTNLAGAFGWGSKDTPTASTVDTSRMLTAPPTSASDDAAAAPIWQRYGKVAMFAGAAGAIAAGGAAAYMKREVISSGVTWATSHLEFVGVLARPEEMRKRLANVIKITGTHDFGFTNLYTTLGHAVNSQNKQSWTGSVLGKDRTFCNLPKGEIKRFWMPAVNDKVTAEVEAHMNMFEPKNNPGYYTLSETAKEIIIDWAENDWYKESEGRLKGLAEEEAELVERVDVDMDGGEEEFEDVRRPSIDIDVNGRIGVGMSTAMNKGKELARQKELR